MDKINNKFSGIHKKIISHIQVNIPYTMLVEENYLDLFINLGINPEIGLDATALDRYSLADFKMIAEEFHQLHRSITIHGPFLDLSPGSPDSKIRELTRFRFEQLVHAVAVFKPKTVVCHAGYDNTRYDFCKEDWTRYSIDTWKWLGNEIYRQGSKLMLENVYETEPEEMLVIFRNLNMSHIGFCLDVGHHQAFGENTLKNWIELMSGYIGQLHLHDNHGGLDSHLGMGEGNIDFHLLFTCIKRLADLPVMTIEPHELEAFKTTLSYLEQSDFLSLFQKNQS